MRIDSLFKNILESREISFNEISRKSGVPKRTIEEWYYNDREPSLYKAEKVLNALGYRFYFEKEKTAKEGYDVRQSL